jgi:hypothetical protein
VRKAAPLSSLGRNQSGNTTGWPKDLPPLASRLGADEFDRIVRGGDLRVVEEGMSALPVSSGGYRASRTAVTSQERGKAK